MIFLKKIYNENINDLLNNSKNGQCLKLVEHPLKGTYV